MQKERAIDLEWAADAASEAGDHKRALRILRRAAMLGSEMAMNNTGYHYDCGLGVKRSRQKAMYWYRRAARRGNGCAAANIATIYRDENRPGLEVIWYLKALEFGHIDVCLELAKHYLVGAAVGRSVQKAVHFLERVLTTKPPIVHADDIREARRLLRIAKDVARGANYAFDTGTGTAGRRLVRASGPGQRGR